MGCSDEELNHLDEGPRLFRRGATVLVSKFREFARSNEDFVIQTKEKGHSNEEHWSFGRGNGYL